MYVCIHYLSTRDASLFALTCLVGGDGNQMKYGSQMALHMAIGLLFLGGGRATIGRSNEAIAALLCALFPRFPVTPFDNTYHLQPLRHLYVLAVERRYLETRDVDTDQPCYVRVVLLVCVVLDCAKCCRLVRSH